MSTPSYAKLGPAGLRRRALLARRLLIGCELCGHHCGVDRTRGGLGVCQTSDRALVSSYGPHTGEEPPLTGTGGSGTIFFSNCNLKCLYCQNWSLSHTGEGREATPRQLASMMLDLQAQGCHNINLVSPTHQVPMLLEALPLALEAGLRLPLVYNTGGYDSPALLKILEGIIDIYMPDYKYSDPSVSLKLSGAPDYPQVAQTALLEMHRQVGDLTIDNHGIATRGLILRHLVLPAGLAGTDALLHFIANRLSKNTYLNIMDQYHPCYHAASHPPLNRRTSPDEFGSAITSAQHLGLTRLA